MENVIKVNIWPAVSDIVFKMIFIQRRNICVTHKSPNLEMRMVIKMMKQESQSDLIDPMWRCKMDKLSDLPNIGEEVERQLHSVGITSFEELKALGAEQAWLKIQEIDDSACIHRLYALEGAIQGIKKSLLPKERKEALKEFYNWKKK